MGFLDSISKTLTAGVDRAKFEADKFQRTSRISGEINNIKSQIDTNTRQLGERALELYQQGAITAPEIASLAQIIAQLREQQTLKETELNEAQGETFEAWHASQPQTAPTSPSQSVPIMSETSTPQTGTSEAPRFTGRSYDLPESTDISGSGLPNSSSVGGDWAGSTSGQIGQQPTGSQWAGPTGGQPAVGNTPYACPTCGQAIANNAAFCPNCGTKVAQVS
ncbi:MAG TPA: zinc ribbon domain-containing protein [Herpetosiphonaceae bacterium]